MNTEETTGIENITEREISELEATRSETEWNAKCDEIKKARGGQYPPDWWPVMMMSGKIAATQASWKANEGDQERAI